MDHDPLCPFVGIELDWDCAECATIAKIRADERRQFKDALLDGTFGYDVDLANSEARAFLANQDQSLT
jgi:hypothetical protein